MKRVFADTFYFLAYLNPNDAAHERAGQFTDDLRATLVTTEWVLVEVANAMSHPANRGKAAEFIGALRRDPRETKGADYHLTSEAAATTCAPNGNGSGCC